MGLFPGLFRSRDKPKDATAGSGYSFFLGGTSAGKAVNERSAMQMTAVYSCVRILAEAVAGLPFHLYKYKPDGGKEKAIEHPLYRILHDEPNPEMTSFIFREGSLGSTGNPLILIESFLIPFSPERYLWKTRARWSRT